MTLALHSDETVGGGTRRSIIARAVYITTQPAPFAKALTLIERVVPVPVSTVEAGWQ